MDVANNDSCRGKVISRLNAWNLTSVNIQGVDHTIILLLIAFKRTICTLPNDYNQVTLPDIQFRSASGVVQTTGEHHQMSDIRQTSPNTEV